MQSHALPEPATHIIWLPHLPLGKKRLIYPFQAAQQQEKLFILQKTKNHKMPS